MNNTKCNGGGDSRTPADIACEFQKGLKSERLASESQRDALVIVIERSEMARGYKLCTLAKTEETWDYYHDIDNYELFDFQKSVEIIKANIVDYAKRNDELGKLIKEGSKMLNDLKAKLHEANNASCAMRNCLQSIIGFGDDCVPDELKAVTDIARSLSDDSQNAAEAMIKIAGIHTFANLNTLKPLSDGLEQAVKNLKTISDDYIKKAGEAAILAQKDLTTVIEELNKKEFDLFKEISTLNAIDGAIEFICEGHCCPIDRVEEICIETSCSDSGDTNGGPGKQPKYAGDVS